MPDHQLATTGLRRPSFDFRSTTNVLRALVTGSKADRATKLHVMIGSASLSDKRLTALADSGLGAQATVTITEKPSVIPDSFIRRDVLSFPGKSGLSITGNDFPLP